MLFNNIMLLVTLNSNGVTLFVILTIVFIKTHDHVKNYT